MARETGETITNSVLDRLIDLEPGSGVENPPSRAQAVRQLKTAVRRDLEWLLNTRRNPEIPDDRLELERVKESLYAYGIPDLSSLSMANAADRNLLKRIVADAIRMFENRLSQVRIDLVDSASARIGVRLRIDAMLRVDPVPEPISFDTVIDLKGGECRLGGDDAR
ncbi:MAG TPA: type VI secretion system baseplate subunit TssE [Terracidiphilus sp.]|nr:type VI secretion system baseplate subunit TssE [Terracidiphilus sp.]